MMRAPKAERRLKRELERLQKDPVAGCAAKLKDPKNIFQWEAEIEGPSKSPYANGIFKLDITFPDNYPIKAPRVQFKTRIWHCNISDDGSICLDVLKGAWSPVLTISKVLLSIVSLLVEYYITRSPSLPPSLFFGWITPIQSTTVAVVLLQNSLELVFEVFSRFFYQRELASVCPSPAITSLSATWNMWDTVERPSFDKKHFWMPFVPFLVAKLRV